MNQPKSLPQKVRGPLAIWNDVFTPAELDAIEALGDALAPMRAEIAGRGAGTGQARITRVAWMERNPQTAWLYARLEEMVLTLNREVLWLRPVRPGRGLSIYRL